MSSPSRIAPALFVVLALTSTGGAVLAQVPGEVRGPGQVPGYPPVGTAEELRVFYEDSLFGSPFLVPDAVEVDAEALSVSLIVPRDDLDDYVDAATGDNRFDPPFPAGPAIPPSGTLTPDEATMTIVLVRERVTLDGDLVGFAIIIAGMTDSDPDFQPTGPNRIRPVVLGVYSTTEDIPIPGATLADIRWRSSDQDGMSSYDARLRGEDGFRLDLEMTVLSHNPGVIARGDPGFPLPPVGPVVLAPNPFISLTTLQEFRTASQFSVVVATEVDLDASRARHGHHGHGHGHDNNVLRLPFGDIEVLRVLNDPARAVRDNPGVAAGGNPTLRRNGVYGTDFLE